MELDEKNYEIVFTGKLVKGRDPKEVLTSLSALFKQDQEKVKVAFRAPGRVIVKKAALEKAVRLAAAIERAGAICELREIRGREATAPLSLPAGEIRNGPVVIRLSAGSTDLTLAPLSCPRIDGAIGGLKTNRMDLSEIPFRHLVMLAAFKSSDSHDEFKLLLFAKGARRPLIVDASAVAFADFPGSSNHNLLFSLRKFIAFLHRQNPKLVVDKGTAEFVSGGPLPLFTKEPVVLASQMAGAYAEAAPSSAPTGAPPPPSTRTSPEPEKKRQDLPAPQFETEDDEEIAEEESGFAELDAWTGRKSKIYALMLLLGFFWPLLKHGTLFGSEALLWPWNLIGYDLEVEGGAALSEGEHTLAWVLLPLLVAAGTLLVGWWTRGVLRCLGLFVVGLLALGGLLVGLVEGAEVLGLILLPPTAEGGAFALVAVVAAAFVAAANRQRKVSADPKALRNLSGAGGGILILTAFLAFFGRAWEGWSIQVLYLLLASYGAINLKNSFVEEPGERALALSSYAARVLCLWLPLTCLLTQSAQESSFLEMVVAGGGVLDQIFSVIKLCLVYYGSALLLTLGLAGTLAAAMLEGKDLP